MRCLYCTVQSKYICRCFGSLCENHVSIHTKTCKIFNIKEIEDEDKLKLLSMELSKRITKINNICCELINKTQKIIQEIQKICNKNVNKLKNVKTKYVNILEKTRLEDVEIELNKKTILKYFPIFTLNCKIYKGYYKEAKSCSACCRCCSAFFLLFAIFPIESNLLHHHN